MIISGGVNMEEEIVNPTPKKNINAFFYIIIVEAITVTVMLLSILVLKSFFKGNYQKFYKWYENTFLTETSVTDIIEEASGDGYEI